MHPLIPTPDDFDELLELQHGAVTRSQVARAGISRAVFRRLRRDWIELDTGLFVVGEVTWDAFAQASLLRGGDDAVLGSATACFLHGLIQRRPTQFTVWAASYRSPLEFGELRADYRRGDRKGDGDPPRLSVEQALLDYARDVSEDDLVEAVTRAFANKKTTPAGLLLALGGAKRHPARTLLTDLCDAANAGIHSVLEWRFQKEVLVPHELPVPGRQVQVGGRNRVDVYYEDFGLIIELDGRAFHDDDVDAGRDNEHALNAGALTLRFTWRQVVQDPCSVARTVARALRQRGWEGGVTACRRCRRLRVA